MAANWDMNGRTVSKWLLAKSIEDRSRIFLEAIDHHQGLMRDLFEPYFTIQLGDTLDLFNCVFYIRNICVNQNTTLENLLCGYDMYVERHPEHLSAVTYYLSSVIPQLSQKSSIVCRFCQISSREATKKRMITHGKYDEELDEKQITKIKTRLKRRCSDPYMVVTILCDTVRDKLRTIIESNSYDLKSKIVALKRISVDKECHHYVLQATESVRIISSMLKKKGDAEEALIILANAFAHFDAPKPNKNVNEIVNLIGAICKSIEITEIFQETSFIRSLYRCVANLSLYCPSLCQELCEILLPFLCPQISEASKFCFTRYTLRVMACLASVPGQYNDFLKAGTARLVNLLSHVGEYERDLARCVNEWTFINFPKLNAKLIKKFFDVDTKNLASADLCIYPLSKSIREKWSHPSKCLLELPLISACNGRGIFQIILGRRSSEGTVIIHVIINCVTGLIQDAMREIALNVTTSDDRVEELVRGIIGANVPYVAHAPIDEKLASRIVRAAERATQIKRELTERENEAIETFFRNDWEETVVEVFQSILSRETYKDQRNDFNNFAVWRSLLSNQIFVDYFLHWGDLKEMGTSDFSSECLSKSVICSQFDSLDDKPPTSSMMQWIIDNSRIIQYYDPIRNHLISIFLQMAMFFRSYKHENLMWICYSVVQDIRAGKSFIEIPAIRAVMERTMHYCKGRQIAISSLQGFYKTSGLAKTIEHIFRSYMCHVPTKNFPRKPVEQGLIQTIVGSIVNLRRKHSQFLEAEFLATLDMSFQSFSNSNVEFDSKARNFLFTVTKSILTEFGKHSWDEMDEWDGTSIHSQLLPYKKKCAMCNKDEGRFRCPKCRRLVYCSRACQELDWKKHLGVCRTTKT